MQTKLVTYLVTDKQLSRGILDKETGPIYDEPEQTLTYM